MHNSLREFGREIAHLMPKFIREVLKRQAKALAQEDITISQMIILSLLKEKKAIMMSEIAKTLSVTTAAATGLVDRMVKSKLVKRSPCKKDRRVINIELTPKGEKAIDAIAERRYRMTMDMFKKLEPIERKRYLEILKKLYRVLREGSK